MRSRGVEPCHVSLSLDSTEVESMFVGTPSVGEMPRVMSKLYISTDGTMGKESKKYGWEEGRVRRDLINASIGVF